VEFLADIRDERRFESLDALVEQIGADVAEARRLIDTHHRTGTSWPMDEGETS